MSPNLLSNTPPPPLRVIVAGTPQFAIPPFQALHDCPLSTIVAVYTQPDRPAGRGRGQRLSAVKQFALQNELPLEQPPSWRDAATLEKIASYAPDLLIVAAYGLILPAEALTIPTFGTINVHASLLPRWRGAAPIQRALIAGDAETGITIMQVVPALDAGPILLSKTIPITAQDTGGSLELKLADLGALSIIEALEGLVKGEIRPIDQDASKASYAAKIAREDRPLDWHMPAAELARRIRALHPEPLATSELAGVSISVLEALSIDVQSNEMPGSLLAFSAEGIDIATSSGALRLLQIQPHGKRPMSARDFINGYGQKLRLGNP
jgi:methionyl-tRNA formyltransferase